MRQVLTPLACLLVATPLFAEPERVVISLSDTESQRQASRALNQEPGESRSWLSRLFSSDDDAQALPAEERPQTSDRRHQPGVRDRMGRKQHDHFDHNFRKYTKHYFSALYDWRWFKAQAVVESQMNTDIRSASGAVGLMQIMPKTFRSLQRELGFIEDPRDPEHSIAAGIYYNRQLYNAWSGIEDEDERRKFMFASYNAGLGTVKRAFVSRGRPEHFEAIEPALPHAPKHYVNKVYRAKSGL